MKRLLFAFLPGCLLLPLLALAQAPPALPDVSISLGVRHGRAIPNRQGFCHTGGGNIVVVQPSPDTLVIAMSAVAVAGAHPCWDSMASMNFDLDQHFEISFDNPRTKRAKLSLEGRVIGLLRSHKGGGVAQQGPALAAVTRGTTSLLSIGLPVHNVSGGENLSVNDRQGPVSVQIGNGNYHLHQSFSVSSCHPWSWAHCKAASSEFAPDPALDPLWISYWEPFHGANKKDFGFEVILRVAAEPDAASNVSVSLPQHSK